MWLLAAGTVATAWLPSASADSASGERVFQRCFACHSVVAGEEGLPGPNLRGVIGRRAAAVPGFRYSPALITAGTRGLVWTRAALDAYLADPQRFLPGTEMAMPGLGVADDRRDVIDYLQQSNPTPRRTP
jgi:cytochrome c